MGKLLTILGIEDQTNLPPDIFIAEDLIIGMQLVYENSPESPKKEVLAKTIAEAIRLTLQQIKGLPLTPPKEAVKEDAVRILTEQEMEAIYGSNWREDIANDDDLDGLDWVSPDMDKYYGQKLTEEQITKITKATTAVDMHYSISRAMTTLNPKFTTNKLEKGEWYIGETYNEKRDTKYSILLRFDKLEKYDTFNRVKADIMFFGEAYSGGVLPNGDGTATMSNSEAEKTLRKASVMEVHKFIKDWAKRKYGYDVTYTQNKYNFGVSPKFSDGNNVVFQDYKWEEVAKPVVPEQPSVERKFKPGDKVKIPKTKQGIANYQDDTNYLSFSNVVKHAMRDGQDYLFLSDIEKQDNGDPDIYMLDNVDSSAGKPDGDFFWLEDLELYEETENTEIIKIEDIDIKGLEWDGDRTDTRLHSDITYYFGAQTEIVYNQAIKEINDISYKGKGWEIYPTYDVSGFQYWMKNQKEQQYLGITIRLDYDFILASELQELTNAYNAALSEIENISYKYNYDPSGEADEDGDLYMTKLTEPQFDLLCYINSSDHTGDGSGIVGWIQDDFGNYKIKQLEKIAKELASIGIVNTDVQNINGKNVMWVEVLPDYQVSDDDAYGGYRLINLEYNGLKIEDYYGDDKVIGKEIKPKKKSKEKKKSTRQSPTISANDVAAGTKKKGVDGNMWIAKKTKAGYNQWKKV